MVDQSQGSSRGGGNLQVLSEDISTVALCIAIVLASVSLDDHMQPYLLEYPLCDNEMHKSPFTLSESDSAVMPALF